METAHIAIVVIITVNIVGAIYLTVNRHRHVLGRPFKAISVILIAKIGCILKYIRLFFGLIALTGKAVESTGVTDTSVMPACLKISQAKSYQEQNPSLVA